jgi:hypothetical protein
VGAGWQELWLGLAIFGAEAPVPDGLRCLAAAYPEGVCAVSASSLRLCDGTELPWDEGLAPDDMKAREETPDLRTMMEDRYLPGVDFAPPPPGYEPGRRRVEAFLGGLYGRTRAEVARELVTVAWMPKSGGRRVRVHGRHGVREALQRVSDELERTLPAALKPIAAKTAGVFNWRTVRRSTRRSPHSWGIAIDIGVPWADYWNWTKPDAAGNYTWRNRFPLEIVEVFERHGFIWGGKWSHFDTMHFEYRPELLIAPCVRAAGESEP